MPVLHILSTLRFWRKKKRKLACSCCTCGYLSTAKHIMHEIGYIYRLRFVSVTITVEEVVVMLWCTDIHVFSKKKQKQSTILVQLIIFSLLNSICLLSSSTRAMHIFIHMRIISSLQLGPLFIAVVVVCTNKVVSAFYRSQHTNWLLPLFAAFKPLPKTNLHLTWRVQQTNNGETQYFSKTSVQIHRATCWWRANPNLSLVSSTCTYT